MMMLVAASKPFTIFASQVIVSHCIVDAMECLAILLDRSCRKTIGLHFDVKYRITGKLHAYQYDKGSGDKWVFLAHWETEWATVWYCRFKMLPYISRSGGHRNPAPKEQWNPVINGVNAALPRTKRRAHTDQYECLESFSASNRIVWSICLPRHCVVQLLLLRDKAGFRNV